jgi:hypothetical protein
MTEDLLASFRRLGAAPRAAPPPQPPTGYSAFSATSASAKPHRLELRPRDGLAVARLYSGLQEIAYDRSDYTGILLIFAGGMMVRIQGRNLRPVTEALLAGTCEYLSELDGEIPPGEAPVIERMELLSSSQKTPG